MFVSHTHKFVLVTPARCGSRVLHEWIRSQPALLAPQVNKMIDQNGGWIHHSFVPGYAQAYPVVMTVRPPRDRFLSIWQHRKYFSDRDAWAQFLDRQRNETVNIWFHSLFEFAQRCRPTYLVRLTHLDVDLTSLPMVRGAEFQPPPAGNYHSYGHVELPPQRERELQEYIKTDVAWLASRGVAFDREDSNSSLATTGRRRLILES